MTNEHLLEMTQREEEMRLELAINEARERARDRLPAIGACHDCGDDFPHSDPKRDVRLFCDAECEEGYRIWREAQVRKHGTRAAVMSGNVLAPKKRNSL